MLPHPQTISDVNDLRRNDFLARAARERRAAQARAKRSSVKATWLIIASMATLLSMAWLAATPRVFAAQATPDDAAYSTEEAENLEVARRFFEELHDTGDLAVAEAIVAPDAVFHIPGAELTGPEGIVGLVTLLRTAFPDAVFPMEDVAVDGETVAVRWTMRGTSQGDFQGIPPTGEPVELRGTAFLRIVDGRIVEDWVTYDQLGLLQQLGAMPGAADATPAA